MPEIGRISALYATNNTLPDMVILKLKLWHWKALTQRYKEVNLPTVSSEAKENGYRPGMEIMYSLTCGCFLHSL